MNFLIANEKLSLKKFMKLNISNLLLQLSRILVIPVIVICIYLKILCMDG